MDLPDCGPGEEAVPAGDGYACGPADLPDPTIDNPPATTTSTIQPDAPAPVTVEDAEPLLKVGLLIAMVAHVVWKRMR